MKRNFLLQILALSGLLAVSCREISIDSEYPEGDGPYLSIMVDTPDTRTRAVDLNPGAALYLKNIWVGVYDVEDGKKVGGGEAELGRMLTASGNTLIDLVKIAPVENIEATGDDRYCVVGVANYDDIKVYDDSGKDEDIDLHERLQNANTWEQFINIAIDTDKSKFENQVPLLVGYLHKESVSSANIKVDQFSTLKQAVRLSDYGADDAVFVPPTIRTAGRNTYFNGINTKYNQNKNNYVLKLRRLRSKINVVIETPVSGVTVTNLQYKICNAPASAFLVQRCTNTFDSDNYAGADYSPNSADVLTNGSANGYIDNTDYVSPQVNTNFSFEHFENLHWARYTGELKEYHDREKKTNGAISALATSPGDWNNRATYFVLKMNIRDENSGRNAEVEYTIHEGFCNDADGISLVKEDGQTKDPQDDNYQTRLKDFSCVRNTDYYYKITINSINDIFVQVTDSNKHTTDQQGKIWDIDYVNEIQGSGDPDPYEGEEEIIVEKRLVLKTTDDFNFNNAKDIAFRFVGSYYDTDRAVEVPVDVCYNFKRGDLDGFADLWNAPTNESSEYIVATDESNDRGAYEALKEFYNGSSDNAAHFRKMIGEIQVRHGGNDDYYNIVEYLEKVIGDEDPDSDTAGSGKEPVDPNIDGFKFSGLKYYEAFDKANDNKRNHLRGLYIFDVQKAVQNGTRVQVDDDECTWLYKINGIEQVPVYLKAEKYQMIYVTGNKNTPIGPNVKNQEYTTFDDEGNGMLLSDRPELAFRLLGFDGNSEKYYDFLYNFTQSEYTAFTEDRSWPEMNLNGTYSTEIAKNKLLESTIPESFLNGIKIIFNKTKYSIFEFVTEYENGDIQLSQSDRLGFEVNQYNKSVITLNPGKFMRAFYLFDKKNKFVKPVLFDEENDLATFQAYAVEQYPSYSTPSTLKLPSMTVSLSGENFLDAGLPISIPVISGVDLAKYKYKIIIESGTKKSECWVEGNPVNGYFNFNIPMKILSGTKGTIKLQAISFDEMYISSGESSIGSYTLNTKINWDFTTWKSEFEKSAWKYCPNPTSGHTTTGTFTAVFNNKVYNYYQFEAKTISPDGYLNIFSKEDGKQIRGYVASSSGTSPAAFLGLQNTGSGCDLKFKVHKDCKIQVTGIAYVSKAADGNKTTALQITGGEPASFDVPETLNASINCTSVVTLGDSESEKEITITSKGGVFLYKVSLSEI